MATSTPQTKPNLFGTLTQKPVKEAKKDTKDLNQPSVSSTKANKSVVSREIVEEKPNTDTKSNVVVTTMSEQSDHSNSVVTATETLSKPQELQKPMINPTLDPELKVEQGNPPTVSAQSAETKEIPFSNREGTNHASLLLTKTNLKFLRIRTRQLGTTLQKYVDLLLREEKERWNDEPGYADTIYDYCENRFKEEKKVMSLITSKEGNDFLNEGSIEAGIKKVTFMNYIISREIEREAAGNKRQSL